MFVDDEQITRLTKKSTQDKLNIKGKYLMEHGAIGSKEKCEVMITHDPILWNIAIADDKYSATLTN